ncbi:antiterminator LoaP [Hungatella hathewayi]
MWYVIQVRTGTEESIRTQCEKLVDGQVLERCFIPYFEEMKRYQGSWHKEKRILFPGYVFAVSQDVEALFLNLKRIIGLTKLLGMENVIIALMEEEIEFLLEFGKEEHIVTMSQGIITNDSVIVVDGPLKGREGLIKRVDRHKRKAWLEFPMLGRMQNIEVGLELLEKKKNGDI